MKAPLIFCSSSYSINVKKIFKIVLAKAFDLRCTIPEIRNIGEPIIEYTTDYSGKAGQKPSGTSKGEEDEEKSSEKSSEK